MDFRVPALKELTDQQTRFAPPARRQEQVARAEQLLGEIEPGKRYPYQFVCFRVTDFRSDAHADLLIPGDDLRHDLALFIRRVERSVPPLPIEQAVEPMLTLDEVSKRFNVSTKTISRWRVKGLVGQRVKVNGRSQLGFPSRLVEKFVAEHHDLVEKGAQFQPPDRRREGRRSCTLARRLAGRVATLTEVSKPDRPPARPVGRGHPVHDQELRPGPPGPGLFPDRQRPAGRRRQGADLRPIRSRGIPRGSP